MHVGRRVYVSNLAWRTSWQDLKDKCVTGATCWPACLISAFSEQAGARIQGLSGGMASKLQSLGRSCERSCLHCSSRSSLFTFLGSPQACRFRECGNVVYSNVIKDEAGEARCGGAGAAAPTAQRRLPVGSLFPALPCASSPAVHFFTAFCVPAALPAGRSKGWGIVEFETPEEALTAINTLNGVELGGRTILVREDREDRDVKQVRLASAEAC